jgi:hypothetical protein
MSQTKKKRTSRKLSPFAEARAQANFLLDIAFSPNPPSNLVAVRVGRRTMRVDEVRAELNAARARVAAQFAQPGMRADAIRQGNLDARLPFDVMAGRAGQSRR